MTRTKTMFITRKLREPCFDSVKKIFEKKKTVLVQTLRKSVFCLLKLASETKQNETN